MSDEWRVGSGYDLHTVASGRALMLGGFAVPWDWGLSGHTDGDVVIHAVVDALFGAAGLPDIGEHFPDHDATLRNMPSKVLLAQALAKVSAAGWDVANVDVTILAEKPQLTAHKPAIRRSLAGMLKIEPARLSIKAKTNEGCDAVGAGNAIACQVCLLLKRGVE